MAIQVRNLIINKNILKLLSKNTIRNYTTLNLKAIPILNYSKMRNLFSYNQSIKTGTKNLTTNSTNPNLNANTSSIDKNEMEHFKVLSHSWWIENGEFEGLHQMNKLRVPFIRDTMINYRNLLPQVDKEALLSYINEKEEKKMYTEEELNREPLLGLNILDIGCGGGILSEPLARLGAQITAIDACKENIICAQLRVESQMQKLAGLESSKLYDRLRYINCTVEDLAVVEDNFNYFDAIVCSEVVEHVNNVEEFVSNSIKLLKNNGFAFYTTINRTTQSYLLAILAAEYVLNLVPRGTHTWDKFVKPDELRNILQKNHASVKFEMGMSYNPLTKNWCWSQNNSINYAMYAQKLKLN